MRKSAALLAALGLVAGLGPATEGRAQPARFDAPADLFYLHPFVNYSLPVRWQADWERRRLADGGLQVSVGSISTQDLATSVFAEVTEGATRHLRFLYRLDWEESPHLDGSGEQHWLGLEVGDFATAAGRIGVELVVNPTPDKGDLDLAPSLVWTDAARSSYLRLGWRLDDFVWEEKNDFGGEARSVASGPVWVARLGRGIWEFASEGVILGPDERVFPDPDLAPVVEQASRQQGASSSAVRIRSGRCLLELRMEHRDFAATTRERSGVTARSASRLRHVRLAWEQQFSDSWRTRAQLHGLDYEHDFDAYRHRRTETLVGAFVGRHLGAGHWIDLGGMGTAFAWETMPANSPYGADRDGWASKFSVGWTLEIEGRGALRALLSHEPDPQHFGGASVQAQLMF